MTGRDTTREAILKALYAQPQADSVTVDAILTTLAAAGKTIVDDPGWQWGVIAAGDRVPYWCISEESARGVAANLPGQLVRHRPATDWEVVPDA